METETEMGFPERGVAAAEAGAEAEGVEGVVADGRGPRSHH